MFFKDKELQRQVDDLEANLFRMKMDLDTSRIRLDALMKAYPHGTTRTGEPRKKPGRKLKVQA
jgi:hypothetical protein